MGIGFLLSFLEEKGKYAGWKFIWKCVEIEGVQVVGWEFEVKGSDECLVWLRLLKRTVYAALPRIIQGFKSPSL